MTWEEVCDHPSLQDLPFRIELNQWGNVEMSPFGVRHGEFEAWVAHLLQQLMIDGLCAIAVGVQTAENVKVPDVIWASFEHRRRTLHEFTYAVAPETCVEILSPSNVLEEQMHKDDLYLQAGAKEFWLCNELGDVRFSDASGPLERSRLCPEFPAKVVIPD